MMSEGEATAVKPMVSILIPAFNSQQWLAETLQSALAQTWEQKEVIVVDDGSSDRTLQIAQQFEGRGVHVVTQKNQGAAAARNKAFSLSKGKYIQWLDADDLLAPDKITRQMDTLDQSASQRTLLSSAWGQFLYRRNRAKFLPTALWQDLSPAEWLRRKMALNLHMQTATWLVSRELTEAAGPWNTELAVDDDGEYFCRVLLESDGVRFVPEAKVFYRASGPGSLSYIGTNRKRESQWHSMQLHIQYLRSLEDSPQMRDACVKYLQTWLMYFDPETPELVTRVKKKAEELGGHVGRPRLSWKYSWIDAIFGWALAKRALFFLPRIRWSLRKLWDRALYRLNKEPHIALKEVAD